MKSVARFLLVGPTVTWYLLACLGKLWPEWKE
jgi:hypothetical protein